MTNDQLMRKVAGGGIPPLHATKFLYSLLSPAQRIKTAQLNAPEADSLAQMTRARPITDEIVDQRPEEYLRDMAAVVAQQEARLAQAEAEAQTAVGRSQELQQQAQQTVQGLQQQLQQLQQSSQQQAAALQQAQAMQEQAGQQIAQMSQRSLVAGQAAIQSHLMAQQAKQESQQFEQAVLQWSDGLKQMIENNPVQQKMQQQAMMQQQAAMQQQAMMQQAQQGGGQMPEGAGAVEQAAAAQQQQKAAALARALRERADGKLLRKIAFDPKKRGPTPIRTMSTPTGPKTHPFAALGKKGAWTPELEEKVMADPDLRAKHDEAMAALEAGKKAREQEQYDAPLSEGTAVGRGYNKVNRALNKTTRSVASGQFFRDLLPVKQASAGETLKGAKKLFGPFRDAADLIKSRPKGMTAVMIGSAMVGGGITGGILLGHYKNRQRKLQEEERRRIAKEKELTTDFASTPQTLKKKAPQLRG